MLAGCQAACQVACQTWEAWVGAVVQAPQLRRLTKQPHTATHSTARRADVSEPHQRGAEPKSSQISCSSTIVHPVTNQQRAAHLPVPPWKEILRPGAPRQSYVLPHEIATYVSTLLFQIERLNAWTA